MMPRKTSLTAIMTGLAVTLAGLMILEGLSRVVLTVRADLSWPESDWYQYAADVGWERRPHFKGLVAGEVRRHDPALYRREFDAEGFFSIDSEQVQGSGRKKILAIGDSNTFGWGVPSKSAFSEVLDDLRADADVINMGVSGHSSFQGYEMLVKHFEHVGPDVIIASYGFNDRRIVPKETASDSRQKFERDVQSHRFDLVRGRIYLFRMIQIALSKVGLIKGQNDQEIVVDARQARTRVSPEHYGQNLERIAQFCRERHVPLLFIVFKDNPAHSEHLRAGMTYQSHGRYEEAEAELRIALNMDNWFSDLARKHLADVLERRGALEEASAMAHFSPPAWTLAQGGKLLHLDVEYNEIMRSVAKKYGATIVEAGLRLSQDASLYLDLAHPDERGHRLVAELLNHELDGLLTRTEATVPSSALPGS
ncbi:MAG TPA: GDSL-type esterase/lipase family protein [Nitrospira sp.]|nr:GDSL-type esterase/lipase family protein [Nitrospira sp.]